VKEERMSDAFVPRHGQVPEGQPEAEPPERGASEVYGRAQWWTRRTGGQANLRRLHAALAYATTVPDGQRLQQTVLAAAMSTLNAAGIEPSQLDRPLLLTAKGNQLEVAAEWDSTAVARVGPVLDVPEANSGVFLFLPLRSEYADPESGLELPGAALVKRERNGASTVVEATVVTPAADLLIAALLEPGRYEAYARPTDPWLLAALRTVDAHWPWIEAEHRLGRGAQLPDKICQLILCAAEWRSLDRDDLDTLGVGVPGHWNAGGTVCDRCISGLGPIVGTGGILHKPPIVELKPVWEPRGCSWVALGPVADSFFTGIGRVTQISLHPTKADELVAAAAGGGVWWTTDGGLSWSPLMWDLPTLTIGAVAYAPSNPAVIYAASGEDGGGYNPAWPGVGVYRSTDTGGTWTLAAPLVSEEFSAIVVHPTDPNILYVAGDRGLHKSRDGGATWLANPGMASLLDGWITDVVLAHDDPDRLYVAVRNNGVFRSTTGGQASGAAAAFTRLDGPNQLPSGGDAGWGKLTIGQTGGHGSQFVAAKMGPQGRRIFRTIDGGATWTELAANVESVDYDEWCSVIAVRPDDENTLLAGALGLRRTTNGGANPADWTPVTGPAAGVHADQQDAVFSTATPGVGYLANDGGVYRTTDGGASWAFRSSGMQITQFYDVATTRQSGVVIAGGAQDNGIYYRSVGGVWRNIRWGDGTGVAVDPTDPQIFYFSSQNGVAQWTDSLGNLHIGLARSTDGGLTYQELGRTGLSGGSPFVTLLKLDPTHPITNPAATRIMFACGYNVLFRSANGGQAWQRVQAPSGTPFTTVGEITALEFAPSDPSVLYLGTSLGFLYRAGAGGAAAGNWTLLSPPGSTNEAMFPDVPIQSIAINPTNPNNLWVTFTAPGATFSNRWAVTNPLGASHVYASTDAGATWADASGRLPGLSLPDVPTSAVAFHPSQPRTLYAGTDVGVFRTTTAGLSWTSYMDVLPRSPISDLSVGEKRLFAATMGRGVYYRDV
jgi:hypothetical protein